MIHVTWIIELVMTMMVVVMAINSMMVVMVVMVMVRMMVTTDGDNEGERENSMWQRSLLQLLRNRNLVIIRSSS